MTNTTTQARKAGQNQNLPTIPEQPSRAHSTRKNLCAFLSTLQTTVRDLVRTYRELYAAMSLES
jgi:arsenate reductase-like glutaredoxin family protein